MGAQAEKVIDTINLYIGEQKGTFEQDEIVRR
jgi:hypothetical protein